MTETTFPINPRDLVGGESFHFSNQPMLNEPEFGNVAGGEGPAQQFFTPESFGVKKSIEVGVGVGRFDFTEHNKAISIGFASAIDLKSVALLCGVKNGQEVKGLWSDNLLGKVGSRIELAESTQSDENNPLIVLRCVRPEGTQTDYRLQSVKTKRGILYNVLEGKLIEGNPKQGISMSFEQSPTSSL